MEKISIVVRKALVFIIALYRYLLSPILGNHCRFSPSCSCYAQLAIARFGVWRGLFLMIKRIFRCHPWNEGGDDPVPEQL